MRTDTGNISIQQIKTCLLQIAADRSYTFTISQLFASASSSFREPTPSLL